ncbi:hypothetical protein IV203_025826 [Nitzschia inconspicua]|uniref:Uncharacterized protein n=1 Tax=Nitzschia inconspicua TaxID=303405 RepID=A0A9K3K8W9_9STRA|nr:hypothetical protein IV203_017673 [Nitzschia inconspicua]KAG7362160.1 hypothetical protein IV203_025826 [Nitzschia inconspicua]
MIQKEPGNTKVNRLRVIHPYEANFNLLLEVPPLVDHLVVVGGLNPDKARTLRGSLFPELHPIFGTGQGSANTPDIWVLVSSQLFNAHTTKANGATFLSPDGSIKTQIYMLGRSFGSLQMHVPPSSLPIHPKRRTNPPVHAPNQLTVQVQESGPHSTTVPIKYLRPTTSQKPLGCYKSPARGHKQSLQAITENAIAKATLVAESALDPKCTMRYYTSIFLPSVTYPLPTCSIPEKQLQKLHNQIARLFLNRLGYSRKKPEQYSVHLPLEGRISAPRTMSKDPAKWNLSSNTSGPLQALMIICVLL